MREKGTETDDLSEIHVWGEKTHYSCARANADDSREWLSQYPVCPTLATYQMEHVGIMHAEAPYEVVRLCQSGAYFLVTTKGKGQILVNGSWYTCSAGEACLLPAYRTNALRCLEGEVWEFCWVRYQHADGQIPLIHSSLPLVEQFASLQFLNVMQGMLYESTDPQRQAVTQQWVQLIHIYVSEFIATNQKDGRLWKLWFAVEQNLERQWDLDAMASVASLSTEHLRRLCKSQYGRSPIQQLRWLRMQRAAELLISTGFKIEAIAYDVGYQNPVAFSAAFKKEFGSQPSQYRIKQCVL